VDRGNPVRLKSTTFSLQRKEPELLAGYTENSVAVQNVRQQMQVVKDLIKRHSDEMRQIEMPRLKVRSA